MMLHGYIEGCFLEEEIVNHNFRSLISLRDGNKKLTFQNQKINAEAGFVSELDLNIWRTFARCVNAIASFFTTYEGCNRSLYPLEPITGLMIKFCQKNMYNEKDQLQSSDSKGSINQSFIEDTIKRINLTINGLQVLSEKYTHNTYNHHLIGETITKFARLKDQMIHLVPSLKEEEEEFVLL